MIKKLISLLIVTCSLSAFADNAWYVSIPISRFDPSVPWGVRFQYTSVLYLTEQGLDSKLPINFSSCATSGCYIGVNTQSAEDPNAEFNLDPGQEKVYFKGSTVGEALTALYKRLGSMTYTSESTAPDRTSEGVTWCGAVGISKTGSGRSYVVMNGGECGRLPPTNIECALLTSDVWLDHKSLSVDQIKNTEPVETGTFQIRCNNTAPNSTSTNILLSIISPDEKDSDPVQGTRIVFEDGGGLVSYLTINDKAALTPTRFRVEGKDANDFTVKSKLKIEGDKVAPGPFYSFAYVILSYE